MTTRFPTDLMQRSAQEASRLLALTYLDEISRAERRLADPSDTEALHDFRVGLRRLRSCLRAYRAPLRGSVSKKIRYRLRDLTLATNAGRDTEVQLAWLRAQAERLEPGQAEGAAWMIGRLEGRESETLDRARSSVGRRFVKLSSRLRPRLRTFEVELRRGKGGRRPSFVGMTAGLIGRNTAELAQALAGVRGAEDRTEAHAARISAKRLRYLLEPLARRVPRVRAIIKRLKQLQDELGDLHDMQVLTEEIGSTVRAPGVEPGLRALERAAAERGARSFAAFQAHWTGGREIAFLARVVEIGNWLVQTEAGPVENLPLVPETSDAPSLLTRSGAGASSPSLSLTSTPLPLRRQLQPRPR